jgi:hypothetical protein
MKLLLSIIALVLIAPARWIFARPQPPVIAGCSASTVVHAQDPCDGVDGFSVEGTGSGSGDCSGCTWNETVDFTLHNFFVGSASFTTTVQCGYGTRTDVSCPGVGGGTICTLGHSCSSCQ